MPSVQPPPVADGNFQDKLELAYPERDQNGCKLQLRCCSMKPMLKRAGGLLIFHLLNVAVAIAGLIFAVLMVIGLLVSLALVGLAVVVAVGAVPFWLLSFVPDRWRILVLLSSGVLVIGYVVIYMYSWLNVYTLFFFSPVTLLFGGLFGVAIFHISLYWILLVAKVDIQLANFATRTIHFKSGTECLVLKGCMKQHDLDLDINIHVEYFPIIMMTCRSWLLLLYFTFAKIVIGAMSAATVFFAVVQPALSLFSGGDGPFFASSMTLHHNPLLYVGIVVSTWVFGVVGILVVAEVSVKLTAIVLCEWNSKQTHGRASELTPQTSPRAAFVELSVTSPPPTLTTSI